MRTAEAEVHKLWYADRFRLAVSFREIAGEYLTVGDIFSLNPFNA
jgi:hypothetical protein